MSTDRRPTKEAARVEVRRLGTLRFFPSDEERVDVFVASFIGHCGTLERIRQAVDHFLREGDESPSEVDIRDWAFRNAAAGSAVERIRDLASQGRCEACDNIGLESKQGMVRDPLKPPGGPNRPWGRRLASWVDFCHCGIGQIKRSLWSRDTTDGSRS